MDDPKRDLDERVNLEMDPEDALRALLGVEPDKDDEEPETGE